MTKVKIPLVVLIGRVNVGKSMLFNRIAKTVRSLAFDYAGVTRDYIKDTITWGGVTFELVDTGGLDVKQSTDPIVQQVQQQVIGLLNKADVIVCVVDASVGVTAYEYELAKIVHKLAKPVVVVANKIDVKAAQEHLPEFRRLGFETVLEVSAAHNQGISQVLDYIAEHIPVATALGARAERLCRVALLGRPNVGKSSLMNALLKQERAIVTHVAGTTREAIAEKLKFYAQTIELVDTPGVRKQKAVKEELEELMVRSSLAAVRTSDIVVLVVDAQEGRLTDQELKLAFYVFDEGKALIIAINKTDLLDNALTDSWHYHEQEYDFFYKKIEMIAVSCKSGEHIGKLLPLIDVVWQRYQTKFNTYGLTHVIKQALLHKPLYCKKQKMLVKSVTQIRQCPPTIKLVVNIPTLFGDRERAFFDGVVRQNYQIKSVPLTLITQQIDD